MIIKILKDKDNIIYPYETVEDLQHSLGLKYFEIYRVMHDEQYRERLGLSLDELSTDTVNVGQKTITCVETGETFKIPKECAEKIGCSISTLSRVLNQKKKYVNGKRYKYLRTYLDPKDNVPIPNYENRYVFNKTTNSVFSIILNDEGKMELKGVLKKDDSGRQKNRVELWKNGKRRKFTIEEIKESVMC